MPVTNRRSGSWVGRRARRAFTLLELLVVIAILAILAALLLPALSGAKAAARQTVCLNKQRQWAVALTMYADDNEGEIPRESFLPNGTTINIWAQVRNPLARNVWYNALADKMGARTAANFAPTPFIPDFYDRPNIFHCPEAAFRKHPEGDPITYFSIAMNSKLILVGSTMRKDTIQQPSDTVVFLDNRLPGETKVDPAQTDEELGQPSAYASRFVTRHRGRGVMAFADGTVRSFPGREVVTNGWAFYPQRNIFWTADPNEDANK